MATTIDRVTGLRSSAAIKAPCRVVASTNLALSGLQTVDGEALAEGDRVLVNGQTDSRDNGIYLVSTGIWQRSPDFRDNRDIFKGTHVYVTGGVLFSGTWFDVSNDDPVVIGTTEIQFVESLVSDRPPIVVSSSLSEYTLTYNCTLIASPSTQSIIVYLPATPKENSSFTVKDGSGNAGTYHITINGNGNTIDGASTAVISNGYASLNVSWDGTGWFLW